MNKTIWALAFVVLCSGMAFAIGNATVDQHTTSKWVDVTGAGNIVTEGGNVSNVTLDVNLSTEKWAGAYGEIDGNLVLAEDLGTANFMYSWTYNDSAGGTACVSTNSNPTWASAAGGIAASAIDTAWGFTPEDGDSAVNTLDDSGLVAINGLTLAASAAAIDLGTWETVVVGGLGTGGTLPYAFCVNISQTAKNNYRGAGYPVDYEVMMPANQTATETETYYFFVELA